MSARFQDDSRLRRIAPCDNSYHQASLQLDPVEYRGESSRPTQGLFDQTLILDSIPPNIWMVSAPPRDRGRPIIINCQLAKRHAQELLAWKEHLQVSIKTDFVFAPRIISEEKARLYTSLGDLKHRVSDWECARTTMNLRFPRPLIPVIAEVEPLAPRRELFSLDCYCIDPPGTAYPEQAISIQRLPGCVLRVWYHVVDINSLCQPGSELGRLLLEKGKALLTHSGFMEDSTLKRLRKNLCFSLTDRRRALSMAMDFEPDLSIHYHQPVLSVVGRYEPIDYRSPLPPEFQELAEELLRRRKNGDARVRRGEWLDTHPAALFSRLSDAFSRGITQTMSDRRLPGFYRENSKPDANQQERFRQDLRHYLSRDDVDFSDRYGVLAQVLELRLLANRCYDPGALSSCHQYSPLVASPQSATLSLTRPMGDFADMINFWQLTARDYGFSPFSSEDVADLVMRENADNNRMGPDEGLPTTLVTLASKARQLAGGVRGRITHITNGRYELSCEHLGIGRLLVPANFDLSPHSAELVNSQNGQRIDLQGNLLLKIAAYDLKRKEWTMILAKGVSA